VISSTLTAALTVHRGWGPALDGWITLGSGLLFTLVNANSNIQEQ
jgi:hypothetical protein